MGYLFLGTGGGIAGAAAALVTSGSFALAFLVYVFAGVLLTFLAAAMSIACAPIRQRLRLSVTQAPGYRDVRPRG